MVASLCFVVQIRTVTDPRYDEAVAHHIGINSKEVPGNHLSRLTGPAIQKREGKSCEMISVCESVSLCRRVSNRVSMCGRIRERERAGVS